MAKSKSGKHAGKNDSVAYYYTRKATQQRRKEGADEPADWGLYPEDQRALSSAMNALLDEYKADADAIRDDLPPNRDDLYTETFCKRYLKNFKGLVERIRSGKPFYLRCVADELAFFSIINNAQRVYEGRHGERSTALAEHYETQNQDLDFEMLYIPEMDGLETDSYLAAQQGFANLEFARWFDRFDNVE